MTAHDYEPIDHLINRLNYEIFYKTGLFSKS